MLNRWEGIPVQADINFSVQKMAFHTKWHEETAAIAKGKLRILIT